MYDSRDNGSVPTTAVVLYRDLFMATPRHAIWNGRHWLPRDADASVRLVQRALAGTGPPLATYFLDDDSMSTVGAVDLDSPDGWDRALAIVGALSRANVPSYAEPSRRGAHVWLTVDAKLPAIVLRYAVLAAVVGAGLNPADPTVEIRPSTSTRSSRFAGGSLRLPWMRHPASGIRYGLYDPSTMRPILDGDFSVALCRLAAADSAALALLAQRYVPRPSFRKRMSAATKSPHSVSARQPQSVSRALYEAWGVNVVPGRSTRCPLHDDRQPSLRVAADDLRAWCFSPTCVLNEGGRGVTAWRLYQLAESR